MPDFAETFVQRFDRLNSNSGMQALIRDLCAEADDVRRRVAKLEQGLRPAAPSKKG